MRVFVALALAVSAAPAVAEDAVDVTRGRDLARDWCSECHLAVADQPAVPSDAIPSFFDVAAAPTTTETSLRAFLLSPHPTMPNFMLSRQELDDLVAYILSLRP